MFQKNVLISFLLPNYHITKTIVSDYGFNFFQKVKIVISNYGFRFNVKTVVGDYDLNFFLNCS